jgi:hypothetical protein
MSGNILDVLSHPVAADPDFYRKGLDNLNALRDTQAKQAIADIYQQSIDPQTGVPDPAKFNLLISQNPRAAWAAGPAMQQQGQAQAAQGQGQQEQVAGHRARLSQMYGIMAPLAAKGGPISLSDIQNAANQAHLSPTEAAQIGQDVNAEGGGDPNHDYAGWLKGRMTSNLTSQEQIARTTPNYQFHNIGGRLVPVDMNANTNPNPGSLITTLSPGEATQIVEVTMDDGKTKQQMPLSDAITKLSTNSAMKILGPTTGGGGGGSGGAANNPLNIRFAGQDGATNAGGFAAFKTPEAGQAATDALFSKYADSGINTLSGLISRWAPPSENDTPGYIARVAKATGLDPNAPINLKDPAVASKIQQAMAVVEGNKNARVVPAPAPAASTPPPAPPAGPPGVQMGGAPPPPPGGTAGPYTGGGIGAALAPGGTANPVVVRGTPLPAGRLSGDVGAMVQGMQLARANPLQQGAGAMVAGPGAPTGNNALAGPSVEPPPQPGWGKAVGTYGDGPAPAAAPPAAPVAAPPAAAQPSAAPIGRSVIGVPEAQRITAEAAAKRGNDLVNQLTASSTVKPILAEMEDVLTKSGGTGFGTAHISAFRQALERLGLTPAAVDVATPQAALETFKKLSAQLQGAQLGTVGGVPTDDRQSLIEASNPSVLNSTAGNKSIIHVLQGTQQALETMGRAWMASPDYQNNPGSFDNWRTKFTAKDPATGGQFDPRAFWLSNMPPDEQHAYLSNMTPKGRAEFKKNWAFARSRGWVDPLPGQPATAPGG